MKKPKDGLNKEMNTREMNILTTGIEEIKITTNIAETEAAEAETKDTFNFRIDKDLKRKFHIKCMEKSTDMSKVLNSFIENYINNE